MLSIWLKVKYWIKHVSTYILLRDLLIINEVWISNRIYWILTYPEWTLLRQPQLLILKIASNRAHIKSSQFSQLSIYSMTIHFAPLHKVAYSSQSFFRNSRGSSFQAQIVLWRILIRASSDWIILYCVTGNDTKLWETADGSINESV
jgi:hypothetical protein